jgi:hypothetical protein
MPSIEQVQNENLNDLEGLATFSRENDAKPIELNITAKVLVQFGAEFKLAVNRLIDERQITASGYLADVSDPEITEQPGSTTLQIRLADYYDYVNKGVKGVKSSRNAPKSPYQFKTLGVGDAMRASLTKYVTNNRSKIRTVSSPRDKALGIGLERKGLKSSNLPTIEEQVDTMGYMIKRFGIKARYYFDDAFNEVFKDFEMVMLESVGNDIIIGITK